MFRTSLAELDLLYAVYRVTAISVVGFINFLVLATQEKVTGNIPHSHQILGSVLPRFYQTLAIGSAYTYRLSITRALTSFPLGNLPRRSVPLAPGAT